METFKSNLNLVTMSELQRKIFHKPMEEISREIEDQVLVRLQEVDILKAMLKECPGYSTHAKESSQNRIVKQEKKDIPGYPYGGPLLEKLEFLEQKHLRMWNKSGMEEMIKEAEGEEEAKETLHNLSQKLSQYPKQNKLIKVQYGKNSRWNCFYTTRMSWIETIKEGDSEYFSVIPKHAPDPSQFINMTPELKRRENIYWTGIPI